MPCIRDQRSSETLARLGGGSVEVSAPAPVVTPEPEPVASSAPPVPAPLTVRPRAPDGLRERLGLR